MDRFGTETSGSESEHDTDSIHRKESINANVRRMNRPMGSSIDLTETHSGLYEETFDFTVFEAAREGSEDKIWKQV